MVGVVDLPAELAASASTATGGEERERDGERERESGTAFHESTRLAVDTRGYGSPHGPT